MTSRAKELLLELVAFYDKKKRNEFPALFYYGYDDSVIDELASMRCIAKMNDAAKTIRLTYTGYDLAMEMLK